MGRTIAQKILMRHSGTQAEVGEIVVARIDLAMGHDGSAPLAIEFLKKLGAKGVFDPARVVFVIDHYCPSPNERVSALHAMMREFAGGGQCTLYDVGEGICHEVIPEKGHILPGELAVGGDSHTCTYGALGAFATGIGSSDLAAAVYTGKLWFRVPPTIKVVVEGHLADGVFAKDLALHIISRVTANGATYRAIEFEGEGIRSLDISGRLTLCNMVVEMGAKAGMVAPDDKTLEWISGRASRDFEPVYPDPDATYERIVEIDAYTIEPLVAIPHRVDSVAPARTLKEIPIHQANLGSCTNGRLEDLRVAAKVLSGRHVHPNVRLIVTPASRPVYRMALEEGIIKTLLDSGAVIVPPSCGWCIGACNGIPSPGENVISTANRNFKGRMGNPRANIYLASPATVAASSVAGRITDPRPYLE
ncbi:MAG TPA: 3-isopropylmalate dehydratase large subunit [Firmicutes bacterium]|nr:3-isopropylmalate dehydratase large subunit [Bacillota bacterium]